MARVDGTMLLPGTAVSLATTSVVTGVFNDVESTSSLATVSGNGLIESAQLEPSLLPVGVRDSREGTLRCGVCQIDRIEGQNEPEDVARFIVGDE